MPRELRRTLRLSNVKANFVDYLMESYGMDWNEAVEHCIVERMRTERCGSAPDQHRISTGSAPDQGVCEMCAKSGADQHHCLFNSFSSSQKEEEEQEAKRKSGADQHRISTYTAEQLEVAERFCQAVAELKSGGLAVTSERTAAGIAGGVAKSGCPPAFLLAAVEWGRQEEFWSVEFCSMAKWTASPKWQRLYNDWQTASAPGVDEPLHSPNGAAPDPVAPKKRKSKAGNLAAALPRPESGGSPASGVRRPKSTAEEAK